MTFIAIKDAARIAGVTYNAVRRWILEGIVAGDWRLINKTRRLRVCRESLDAYLSTQSFVPPKKDKKGEGVRRVWVKRELARMGLT